MMPWVEVTERASRDARERVQDATLSQQIDGLGRPEPGRHEQRRVGSRTQGRRVC